MKDKYFHLHTIVFVLVILFIGMLVGTLWNLSWLIAGVPEALDTVYRFLNMAVLLGLALIILKGCLWSNAISAITTLVLLFWALYSIIGLISLWGTVEGLVFLFANCLPTLYTLYALAVIEFSEER